MSRKDKADKAVKPPSGPLGPWRLVLVVFAVATTSGAVLAQSVQTGVGVDLALGRALAVAVVLWILLGSIDRVLAHAQHRHAHDQLTAATDPDQRPSHEVSAP